MKGVRCQRPHVVLEVRLRGSGGPGPELEQVNRGIAGEGVRGDAAVSCRIGRAHVNQGCHERDLGSDTVVDWQLRPAKRDRQDLSVDPDRSHESRDGIGTERREPEVKRVREADRERGDREERERRDAARRRREALDRDHGDRKRDAQRDEALREGLPAGDLKRRQQTGEEEDHGGDSQATIGGVRVGATSASHGHDGRGGDGQRDDRGASERPRGDGPREHRDGVAPPEPVEALREGRVGEVARDEHAGRQDRHGREPREPDPTQLGEPPSARRPSQRQS